MVQARCKRINKRSLRQYWVEFPNAPIIKTIGNDRWELVTGYRNRYTGRIIKKGFTFDGASIPRVFWRLVGHPMQSDVLTAALEHDADYNSQRISRKEADSRFLQNMRRLGVSKLKRISFYLAVRGLGWIVWNKNKPDVPFFRHFVYNI